jgi:hypothetical protein
MASNTARAAACPCPGEISAPTRPNGPDTAPSASIGTWPDTKTRLPRTRTRLAGTTMPGGSAHGFGSSIPISERRRSMLDMANFSSHREIGCGG